MVCVRIRAGSPSRGRTAPSTTPTRCRRLTRSSRRTSASCSSEHPKPNPTSRALGGRTNTRTDSDRGAKGPGRKDERRAMSKVFITGSSDGLGLMAAKRLMAAGHEVVLHARNQERARDGLTAASKAHGVVVGDLASIVETRELADQANRLGPFDAVIHNAGVGDRERRIETVDGLEHIFAINVLAPYLLTALIGRPKRLIYLSSGMHRGGDPDLTDLQWTRRRWDGPHAASDAKPVGPGLALAVRRGRPGGGCHAACPA